MLTCSQTGHLRGLNEPTLSQCGATTICSIGLEEGDGGEDLVRRQTAPPQSSGRTIYLQNISQQGKKEYEELQESLEQGTHR